eukprot:UN22051
MIPYKNYFLTISMVTIKELWIKRDQPKRNWCSRSTKNVSTSSFNKKSPYQPVNQSNQSLLQQQRTHSMPANGGHIAKLQQTKAYQPLNQGSLGHNSNKT